MEKIYVKTVNGRWIDSSNEPKEGYEETDFNVYFYILDKGKKFAGYCENTMRPNGFVDYMDKPVHISEYKPEMDKEVFDKDEIIKLMEIYLAELQKPFEEITEERYYDLLECVPPKKWEHGGQLEHFYVGECYTANLYTCCVHDKKTNKYWSALRSISLSKEELIKTFDFLS